MMVKLTLSKHNFYGSTKCVLTGYAKEAELLL